MQERSRCRELCVVLRSSDAQRLFPPVLTHRFCTSLLLPAARTTAGTPSASCSTTSAGASWTTSSRVRGLCCSVNSQFEFWQSLWSGGAQGTAGRTVCKDVRTAAGWMRQPFGTWSKGPARAHVLVVRLAELLTACAARTCTAGCTSWHFALTAGEELLRKAGLPYTVVRPGGLTDDPAGQAQLAVAQGDKSSGRVARADVAAVAVAALTGERGCTAGEGSAPVPWVGCGQHWLQACPAQACLCLGPVLLFRA